MSVFRAWPRLRVSLVAYALVAWISLAESKLLQRLLFQRRVDHHFVLASIQGVLAGTPVSKSWQQRFLAPICVAALDRVSGNRNASLELFNALAVFAANLLLFQLLRRKGSSATEGVLAVACFGLVRLLLTYRLEYPWDGIDILLFLSFGYWASKAGSLLALAPWLVLGTLNHETILYVPLWYLLTPLDRSRSLRSRRKQLLLAVVAGLVIGASILLLRDRFYLGRPSGMPSNVFEEATPIINNHLHVLHNLEQLFVRNWPAGRAFVSLGFLSAVVWLIALACKREHRTSAVWSLALIATIVCFGYINETRHYFILIAFWFAYAWPVPFAQRRISAAETPAPVSETERAT